MKNYHESLESDEQSEIQFLTDAAIVTPSLGNSEVTSKMNSMRMMQGYENFSRRDLLGKRKEVDKAILNVQTKINFLKKKESQVAIKLYIRKKRETVLDRIRTNSKMLQELREESLKREKEELERKLECNRLIKQHQKGNKHSIFDLTKERMKNSAKKFKIGKERYSIEASSLRKSLEDENFQRANGVRKDKLAYNERRREYFLEKLKDFKNLREDKLRSEMRVNESYQKRIHKLEEKQMQLLEKLDLSESFRIRIQQEYKKAKQKSRILFEKQLSHKGISGNTMKINTISHSTPLSPTELS